MGDLEGKVALVTGGGKGIGKAVSVLFAKEGADVALNYSRSLIEAHQTLDEIINTGRKGLAICADVSDKYSVQSMVDQTIAEMGQIDILVNNAGIRDTWSFLDISFEQWRKVISTNLTGNFLCSQAVAKHMVKRGKGGKIVNISSVAGYMAMPKRTAYVSSKHGIIGLTRQMAMELGDYNIQVNAVGPGVIETSMTEDYFDNQEFIEAVKKIYPSNRWGQPEEVANMVLFLASWKSDFISGVCIPIDGGFSAGKGILSQK